MNNKSKLFLSAHRECLIKYSATNLDPSIPSAISAIFLDLAHLYLHTVPGADQSDYWISFVFDTCCCAGMCSERYISFLSVAQKRGYIKKTLEARLLTVDASLLRADTIAKQIVDFATSEKRTHDLLQIKQRNVANAILDYAHILISVDRRVDQKEESFFNILRDRVYRGMGWRQDSVKASIGGTGITVGGFSKENDPSTHDRTVEQVFAEIDQMTGLQNIKDEVRSLVNILRVQKLRAEAGLSNPDVSNHMVFYGNPGTGKTTIARKLGEIYNILGILSKGHFIEIDRGGLVGGYLGQTAIKTTEVLDRALGGILFIDEAYSLSASDGTDQYGQEAIDTILKYMEDHREDIVVIVAGYQEPMARFMSSNPGLKSRFNKYFYFEDYSSNELQEIFISIADSSNYRLSEDARDKLSRVTDELVRLKALNFGNGRTMRNLFERTISNQANRIIMQNTSARSDLTIILSEDISWKDAQDLSR
jgi:SpoVK/Ycf46/Vps4 family AAA+-type ATPase